MDDHMHRQERKVGVKTEDVEQATEDEDRSRGPVLGVWNKQSSLGVDHTSVGDELPLIGDEPVVAPDPQQP